MSLLPMKSLSWSLFALAALVATPMAYADAKADVLASHQAMVKAGKFRVTAVTESKHGNVRSTSEIVWPDRYHIKGDQSEFIILPDQTYMNQGGKWAPFPMNMSAMIKQMTPDALKQGYANMTNVKELGAETINGKATKGYEYDTEATVMGIHATSHVQVWLEDGTLLPVKQVVEGEAMGTKSHTVSDYEFASDITVVAPL